MKKLLPGMPACPLKSVRLIGSDGKRLRDVCFPV